jgi:hypothetical protein
MPEANGAFILGRGIAFSFLETRSGDFCRTIIGGMGGRRSEVVIDVSRAVGASG